MTAASGHRGCARITSRQQSRHRAPSRRLSSRSYQALEKEDEASPSYLGPLLLEPDLRLEPDQAPVENAQRRADIRIRGRLAEHRVRVQHVEQADLRRDPRAPDGERL